MMKKIMLGNEAVARGAYEAGVKVISSYPGTPSTEVTEYAVKYDDIYCEWAPNEKVAMEVAVGAAIGGARAMTCMKHVGMNVAADPLFTAAYTGVNGGLVVFVADDPAIHSSQNEQDSRFYARSANVPMLEPSDSAEAKDFIKLAFDLSEKYDTPVIVRSNTRISHSRSIVELEERVEQPLKTYEKDFMKYVMMPGMAIKRHVIMEQRIKTIAEDANTAPFNKIEYRDREIGIITSGTCYQYVKEALPEASVLKLGMVYPLPEQKIREFAANVKKLYVVEELEPFIEEKIKAMGIPVVGKEILTIQGEYSTNMLRKAFQVEMPELIASEDVPGRPPVMCVGCPHRAVFYAFNKLGLTVSGDIGCYTLGAYAPLSAMDMCVCMGASIGMAHGMEKARGSEAARHMVSVIGDSTFIHSGITGLINMVYNQSTGTVVILDNSITGMTGHQDNPTTGKNAKGEPAPEVDLEVLAHACGVKHVVVVDPFNLKEFIKVLKEETAREEVSVVIAQRPCDLIVKKKEIKPVNIENCVNCGACMKLGCPALMRAEGYVTVDTAQCNGCGLCKEVCAFGAIHGGLR